MKKKQSSKKTKDTKKTKSESKSFKTKKIKATKKEDKTKKTTKKKKTVSKNKLDDNEVKRISTKNVVYIEIDEEITTVFDRVKKLSSKEVFIVVPKRSQLLQSIVNLKILKRKVDEINKKISIITNDKTGINLAYQCGLNVYDKIDYGQNKSFRSNDNYRLKITPLSASENVVSNDRPRRLQTKKVSIADIIKTDKKSHVRFISDFLQARKKKKSKKKEDKPKLVLISPNKQALITLSIISVLIFVLISYIALPSATIILTPESSILEEKVNITLADYEKNRVELETHPPHMVASYQVSVNAKTSFTHYAANKVTKTQPSHGIITAYNTSNKKWDLMSNTRFQTDDGIVFRTQKLVSVPPGTEESPGKLDIDVVADELDANELPIGDRGNIGPSKFHLPALRDSSRSKLWGESVSNMTGGSTESLMEVTEEDIEAAKKTAQKEIVKVSKEDLESQLLNLNIERESDLSLFDSDKAIRISEPKIIIPTDVIGKNIDKFDVYIEAFAVGIAFNENDLANILKSELQLKKSPQKKIVKIYDDDITYEVLDVYDDFSKIKLTATIKGLEMYEINADRENGERLINKIKDHVLSKEIREAEDYMQNLSEINKVVIENWPVWSPNMPKLSENIDIVVLEE